MTKHAVRDPVTGRFIKGEPVKYTQLVESVEESFLLHVLKWAVAIVSVISAIVVLSYLLRDTPEEVYIVVQEDFELAGSQIPETVLAAVQKEETPAIEPAPQKKEITIYRNGQLSETVTVD